MSGGWVSLGCRLLMELWVGVVVGVVVRVVVGVVVGAVLESGDSVCYHSRTTTKYHLHTHLFYRVYVRELGGM